MGLKFKARVVLDIEEHPAGLAQQLISDEARSTLIVHSLPAGPQPLRQRVPAM